MTVVLLAGWLGSCAMIFAAEAADPAADPHRDRHACSACHTETDGKPAAIPIDKADAICIKCHDGKRASRELHPVGGLPDASHVANPAWPLRAGRLGCLTCHDMKIGCIGDLDDQTNQSFLRGGATGKQPQVPFCLNCHQEPAYRKVNPHLMLAATAAGPKIIELQCLYCHERVPDAKAGKRSGNPMLKADAAMLCHDCHQRHRNGIADKHRGARVSPEMQALSVIRESLGFACVVPPSLVAEVKAQNPRPTLVPLDAGGRLTCTSCHNPHQAGLFDRKSELAYRALSLKQDGHLASPVRNTAWCRSCHEF